MAPRPFPSWARLHFKVHAVSALVLGLALIFLPAQLILYNPLTVFISHTFFRQPLPPLSLQANHEVLGQSLALSGVFSFAIGVAYFLSLYHGYEEWLYLSIPARLLVSAMGHLVYVMVPEKTSPLLFTICVWDGVWAAVLAFAGGSVTGKVPDGYERGRKEL